MKKLAIFLGGILVLPAFAEVAPVFYEDLPEYVDGEYFVDDELESEIVPETVMPANTPVKISRQINASRNSANRATAASRATPTTNSSNATGRASVTANANRVVASRTAATPRTTTSRTATMRGTTSRTNNTTRGTTARSATDTSSNAARISVRSDVASVLPASTDTSVRYTSITGSGGTLYNPTNAAGTNYAETRVGVRDSSSASRSPVIRVASTTGVTSDSSIVTSTADMDELAELTDYCKAQYAACMDNYCNVLDDNQGRCSCSANLKNYAKAEAALKAATEELQDVAQKIQYIGLSAREVETLFSQTEAELKMQSQTDNSQLKTSLDKIKGMIIDVKSGNATNSTTSGINFDLSGLLDFTIDSTGFDLNSFLDGFSNNSDVTNQRGVELYKTATNRCKSNVLRACTAQGVDASLITNAYDLEIDKECMAYERSLNDSNSQMTATIRNAQSVLQRARLLVAQAKNEYGTMRECVNALDSCMQDDFVCGSDYENCLDPSGRYIVNGAIVVGSQPGHVIEESNTLTHSAISSNVCNINLYRTWDFDGGCSNGNAWGANDDDTLANYIDKTVTTTSAKDPSVNMSEYLQNKIGYVDSDGNNHGMCISVLNKCQDYTYTGRGTNAKYNPKNDVIKQYLARVLTQIKAKQDEMLSDYAANCITDVNSCLAQNNYPSDDPTTTASTDPSRSGWSNAEKTQANIAVNACRSQIVTCMSTNGYSIETPTPQEIACWVMGLQFDTTNDECSSYMQNN